MNPMNQRTRLCKREKTKNIEINSCFLFFLLLSGIPNTPPKKLFFHFYFSPLDTENSYSWYARAALPVDCTHTPLRSLEKEKSFLGAHFK